MKHVNHGCQLENACQYQGEPATRAEFGQRNDVLVSSLLRIVFRQCYPSYRSEVDTSDYNSNTKCAQIVDINYGPSTESTKGWLILKLGGGAVKLYLYQKDAPNTTGCLQDGKADLVCYNNNVASLAV